MRSGLCLAYRVNLVIRGSLFVVRQILLREGVVPDCVPVKLLFGRRLEKA